MSIYFVLPAETEKANFPLESRSVLYSSVHSYKAVYVIRDCIWKKNARFLHNIVKKLNIMYVCIPCCHYVHKAYFFFFNPT